MQLPKVYFRLINRLSVLQRERSALSLSLCLSVSLSLALSLLRRSERKGNTTHAAALLPVARNVEGTRDVTGLKEQILKNM